MEAATEFINCQMGGQVNRASRGKVAVNLTHDELQTYIKRFQLLDSGNKGYISINDIRRSFKVSYFVTMLFFVF